MEDVTAHRARFAAAMTTAARRLPFGLSRVVPPSLLGYLLINLCTFFLDLGLLAVFHGALHWPLPVAVTLSYASATTTSYLLNRVLNFRSHASMGRQFPVFVAVSASNYLIFVLGLTDLLAWLGVYYELSRVIAAICEAAYLYCMMRWVVFRDTAGQFGGTVTDQASVDQASVDQASVDQARVDQARAGQAGAGDVSADQGGAVPGSAARAPQRRATGQAPR
jgi:putative flippase GtrA